MIIAILTTLSGCDPVSETHEVTGVCTVTIDAASVGQGMILDAYEVPYTEGMTVLDQLHTAVQENGILMETTGFDAVAYVAGINNIYEFDNGPASGWVYYINDVSATQSAGAYELKEGDAVKWVYITE
jgi:hypothetical protein